jgi:ABC-2 type transport system ATP-binding protein
LQNYKKIESQSIISFQNVSKSYKKIKALDNISLNIKSGDIFGYIGPNGAGKTTTMKILVGLIRDYQGEVFLRGKNISENLKEVHKHIGFLPQEVGFQEWRTVEHLLKTFGRLSNIPSNKIEEKIEIALKTVSLLEVKNRKIQHLSGGMKQKLRFAQAIIHEPEILILDEPLSGLDPASRFQIKEIIKKMAEKGKTIFVSSHILSDVQGIANRIGILNKGRILKVGSPKELQEEFQIGNDLRIEFSEYIQDKTFLTKIKCIESYEQEDENNIILKLKSKNGMDDCILEILGLLVREKVKIKGFNIVKPDLERVYLNYIKKEMEQ